MRNILFTLLLVLGFLSQGMGQDVNHYRYVRVPEKFDFLKENEYQLNALTAFLLKKEGFEVIYKQKLPAGLDPCEVLQADVQSNSSIFRSKLVVILRNCKNQIVFSSKTGSSGKKDYKASYQEALRDAFGSFEDYDHGLLKETSAGKVDTDESPAEVVVDPVVTSEEIEEKAEARATSEAKGNKFLNAGVSYMIEESPTGFTLYKDGEKEIFARLVESRGTGNYLYSSKNVTGNAFFDTSGNLVVEYLDPSSGQLLQLVYKLEAQ